MKPVSTRSDKCAKHTTECDTVLRNLLQCYQNRGCDTYLVIFKSEHRVSSF